MRLTTSQAPGKFDALPCFGPCEPDGYGVCYNPRDDDIILTVSSWVSNNETNTLNIRTQLENALLDMVNLANKL